MVFYLDKGIKYFEDLFLDEDRLVWWIIQELDEAVLQDWQKMLHCSYQGTPLLWFLVPSEKNKTSFVVVSGGFELKKLILPQCRHK